MKKPWSPLDIPVDRRQCVHVEVNSNIVNDYRKCVLDADTTGQNGFLCGNHQHEVLDPITPPRYFRNYDDEIVQSVILGEQRELERCVRVKVRVTCKGEYIEFAI